eukprot:IDg19775t1
MFTVRSAALAKFIINSEFKYKKFVADPGFCSYTRKAKNRTEFEIEVLFGNSAA